MTSQKSHPTFNVNTRHSQTTYVHDMLKILIEAKKNYTSVKHSRLTDKQKNY